MGQRNHGGTAIDCLRNIVMVATPTSDWRFATIPDQMVQTPSPGDNGFRSGGTAELGSAVTLEGRAPIDSGEPQSADARRCLRQS
jgi:hypothetical protein